MQFTKKAPFLLFTLCGISLSAMDNQKTDQEQTITQQSTQESKLNGWLLNAVRGGDIERVEQLLKQGADVNAKRGLQQDTALHLAAYFGYTDIAKLLLDYKASVHAVDGMGHTPLHDAMTSNNSDLVELLLKNGAYVSQQTKNEDTPLHLAVIGGNKKIIRLLLARNADINAQNSNKATPLNLAVQNKKTKTVHVLLQYKTIDVDIADTNGLTPLHWAVGHRYIQEIQALLNANASTDLKELHGYTVLDFAKFKNDLLIDKLFQNKKKSHD